MSVSGTGARMRWRPPSRQSTALMSLDQCEPSPKMRAVAEQCRDSGTCVAAVKSEHSLKRVGLDVWIWLGSVGGGTHVFDLPGATWQAAVFIAGWAAGFPFMFQERPQSTASESGNGPHREDGRLDGNAAGEGAERKSEPAPLVEPMRLSYGCRGNGGCQREDCMSDRAIGYLVAAEISALFWIAAGMVVFSIF